MKTIIELMTALSSFSADSIDMAAKAAVQSGLPGSRDIFMAWGASINIPVSKLQAEWKAHQPVKAAGAKGFADTYYDWLAEASREEQEAADYIMGNESANVRNHLTHYLNIWALTETVRKGSKVVRTITAGKAEPRPSANKKSAEPKAEKDTWEYNAADPYADVRSAKETMKREMAKPRPRKTAVHPDKVAHLNDAAVSKMYTEAFQAMNKTR